MKLQKFFKSSRNVMTTLTIVALVLILFFSRHELFKAWELLSQANLWLILLLIPFQIIVYYAGGEMIFSYLRRRKLIKHISHFEQTRIALESNLVNHIFPSGGVSGISYTTWRLSKLGVDSAKSTFAQVVRYIMGFVSFVVLMIVSVLFLAIDGQINRYIVASSFALIIVIFVLSFLTIYALSSKERMNSMSIRTARFVNRFIRIVTFGRIKEHLNSATVEKFFMGMHKDFNILLDDKKLLIRPFIWGIVYAVFDVAMFIVAFAAIGETVNPAVLMVGYGTAGLASLVALTPGGAGVYEFILIFFLTMAGVSADAAIAGTILTRAILLTGTIVFGYIFYQHALLKYGRHTNS